MLVALPSAGCAASAAQSHAFKLDRPALRDLARRQRGGEILFEHEGKVYEIRERHDAELDLKPVPCATWQDEINYSCLKRTLPLAEVSLSADDKLLPELPVVRVASATLRIDNYAPEGWEPGGWARVGWVPKWGIGAALMGPAAFIAFDAQWFPAEELALQAGVGVMLLAGYVGTRVRLVPSATWCPWIGGFASGYVAPPGAEDEPSADPARQDVEQHAHTGGALAARLGVDVGFNDHTFLVSPEIDLLFPLGQEYLGATSVTPWGGLTLTRLY